jgi:glycosyltransferase involved in cell wall biosynthesis
MARIAVAHADLTTKGGSESVCMNVLEALQGVHEVTLLTLTSPDLNELNRYFRTAVRDVDVRRSRWPRPLLGRLDGSRDRLRNALLNRFVADHRDEFDLVVATDDELSVRGPLVQYVHAPRFAHLAVSRRVSEDRFRDHVSDRLAWRFGNYHPEQIRSSTLLANSEWTADVVQDAYDERPTVVHPPVDIRGFDEASRSWDDRDPGFVAIGRLAPDKDVLGNVEILDRVRDRGHDVHLHLVGPDSDGEYAREVERSAADREYVHLDGEVSREKLVELVSSHRYGLHGARHDGFSTAVAELVAGGTIPFVPDRGSLPDVVGTDELTYDTAEEAAGCIDRVLSNPNRARKLRRAIPGVGDRFSRRRFHRQMREIVAEELSAEKPSPVRPKV